MPLQQIVAQVLAEIRSAWRFRWFGAAAAWVIFLVGWGWTTLQPDVYEATARVYVDTSSVLRPLLQNRIVPPDVATQIGYVRQALLGRPQLETVARQNGLDVGASTPEAMERVIAKLRDSIEMTGRDATNSVYTISYRNIDRDKAVGVVTNLLNALVEETLGAKQQGTETASQFLEDQIREYENRLQQAEQRLAEFKKRNADRLPGAQGGYFERLRAEKDALEKSETALRLAESKRDELRAQLKGESPVVSAGGSTLEPPPNSIDARIRDQRARLDQLLLQYTEKHPDVIAVRESLERLEQQRAEQLKALGAKNVGQELSSLDANPVYQALRIALNQVEVEIAAENADVNQHRAKVQELQSLVNEVPEVEAELARLNRDYNVVNEEYQALVRSRETQSLSEKAADTDEIEFKVIDPPHAGLEPVAPNRLLLLAAAFVAALGAGGGVCWMLSQMRPVFTSVASLRDICGLPVLGAVSQAAPAQYRARRRLELLAFGGALAVLTGFFTVVLLIEIGGPSLGALLR